MSSCPRLPRSWSHSPRSWSVISTSARARPQSSTLPPRALVLPANEYREHPSPEIYLPPLCVASSRMLAPLVPCHILARALVHTPSASLHLFREREPQALVVLKINYADFNYVTALAPPPLVLSPTPLVPARAARVLSCPRARALVHDRGSLSRVRSRCSLMISTSTRPPTMHPLPLCVPRPRTLAPARRSLHPSTSARPRPFLPPCTSARGPSK